MEWVPYFYDEAKIYIQLLVNSTANASVCWSNITSFKRGSHTIYVTMGVLQHFLAYLGEVGPINISG